MHPVACCSQVKRRDSNASMTDELFRISRQNSMTSVGGEDFADVEVAQTLGPRASPTPTFLPPDGKSYPPPRILTWREVDLACDRLQAGS